LDSLQLLVFVLIDFPSFVQLSFQLVRIFLEQFDFGYIEILRGLQFPK